MYANATSVAIINIAKMMNCIRTRILQSASDEIENFETRYSNSEYGYNFSVSRYMRNTSALHYFLFHNARNNIELSHIMYVINHEFLLRSKIILRIAVCEQNINSLPLI